MVLYAIKVKQGIDKLWKGEGGKDEKILGCWMQIKESFAAWGFWIDRKNHAMEINRLEFI